MQNENKNKGEINETAKRKQEQEVILKRGRRR